MSEIESVLGMLPDRLPNGKQELIFTPPKIAREMVEALPNNIWNSHTTFFDPCCKSGIFLHAVYNKLMESESVINDFPNEAERREHIFNHQLYGIAMNSTSWLLSMRVIFGQMLMNSHIIMVEHYMETMRNVGQRFLLETLQKEFNAMKFDIVIGNPPYNRGGTSTS